MKRCLPLLLAVMILICSGCSKSSKKTAEISFLPKNTTDSETVQDAFRTVAESDDLILQFNDKTTDIAVTNKDSGFVWSSANREKGDETAYNLLYLTYHTDAGNVGTFSTTFNCLSKGQYRFEEIENGIKVSYSLGDVVTEFIYPETLMPDRYEHFYNLADEDGQYLLDIVYTKIDISFYDEETQAEMNKKYPFAKGGEVYIQRSVLNDSMKAEISGLFADFGYTRDDLSTDHTVFSSKEQDSTAVNVSVYYRLEEDGFSVEIPEKEIQYDSTVHVDSVNVLECFVGQSMENGYFVLPDGSGSIMKFRNGKTAKNYRTQIYGQDYAINAENKLIDLQNAPLPVYGCVTGDNGYFAVVEDGESHTFINAVSGTESVTPRAWIDFTVEPMDYMVAKSNTITGADNKASVYQTKRYNGSLKIKYRFLSGKQANYSFMASYYRDKLFGDASVTTDSYPLTCEIVGAADLSKTVFGIQYEDILSLTTFQEAKEIATDFSKSGVDDLQIILSGWNGAGVRNGYTGKWEAAKVLGGQKELQNLISSLKQSSTGVFLNCDVRYASDKSGGKNAAVFLDESKAKRFAYDSAVFTRDDLNFQYLLSPQATVQGIKEAVKLATDLSCGLSLDTVGSDLNSDFNLRNTVDRQDALQMVRKELSSRAKSVDCITSVGNAYVFPYANRITNLPIRSDRQDMTDESIPFLAMVLSGRVAYSAPSLNDGYSGKTDLLRMIESGAACSATLTAKDSKSADLSAFDLPTAMCYRDLKESVLSSYQWLREALCDVYGKAIVAHTIHENGIREVEYENGIKLFINYSNEPKKINGVTVPATDYVREGK